MARPSLKEERKAEILDAYGRCIAQHGIGGTTLEMVAEDAGLARALIRHNVGNKDDILDAFLERFLADASKEIDDLFDELPEADTIETLIEWLFDPRYMDTQNVRVSNALFMAAVDLPKLAKPLRLWTSGFTSRIAEELGRQHPKSIARAEAVAAGIVALYFNFETLAPLGGVARLRSTFQESARLLASTLRNKTDDPPAC